MKTLSHSQFATKLTIYTMTGIFILFSILFIVSYQYNKKQNINAAITDTLLRLDNMQMGIDSHLKSVEISINNTAWMFDPKKEDESYLKEILIQRLRSNSHIISSCIAFEPNHFPDKGRYYMLMAKRNGNAYECIHLGSDIYDYFTQDWYLIPKYLKKSGWSEPYIDPGNNNILMCTYSRPLFDSKGNMYAIFTADISLEDFTNVVSKLQPFKKSFSFLLSRNGFYITHYKKESILNESIFSNALDKHNLDYDSIGRMMTKGVRGYYRFCDNGTNMIAFFRPISAIGWSVCTACPESVILDNLNAKSTYFLLLFLFCAFVFFGIMAYVTNILIKQLRSTMASNERIESELHIAQSIQMGMIPKIFPPFPDRSDIDVYAYLRPAREVGGDLYDFFINQDRLYFTIGDVSGKGIPSSLFMAVTRSLFRNVSSHNVSPQKIMETMNATISENNDSNMFVTLLVGVLELKTGRLMLCNAGHNPPVLMKHDTGKALYMKLKTNLPVGLISTFHYEEEEHQLDKGDILYMYTDGVTEAENLEKKQYGEQRVIETLEANRTLTVHQLTDRMKQSIEHFTNGAEQSDDMTMLLLAYQKPKSCYTKQLRLINRLDEVAKLHSFIEEMAADLHLDPSVTSQLDLALEEAVVNVINYAYPANTSGVIGLEAEYDNKQLTFTLTDSGSPFDPTKKEDADVTLSVEKRPIGGLGILLIKRIMNNIAYQYVDNRNELTMQKEIPNQKES